MTTNRCSCLTYYYKMLSTNIRAIVGDMTDTIYVHLQDAIRVTQPEVEKLWGMSQEWGAVILPTVVSIAVFVFGVLIDRCLKANDEKNETIAFRDALFGWIDLVKEPVEKQVECLQVFSKAIKENRTLQNERLAFSRNMVDKIDMATAENVIKYLMFNSSKPKEDRKAVNSFNLISQIDFLKSLEAEIRKQYDAYQRESLGLFGDWNKNIVQIQRLCAGNYTLIEDDALIMEKLIDILYEWKLTSQEDKEVDIPKAYNSLIVPILKRCETHQFCQSRHTEIDGIKESALELANVYKRWHSIADGFSKVFADYATHAHNALKALIEAKTYFVENTRAIK